MDPLQKTIHDHYREVGWEYWTQHEILARLTEETGELAREINHLYGPKKKKTSEQVNSIKDEVGDIMYTLACLANKEGFSLSAALEQSIKKVKDRDHGRFSISK